MKEAILYRFWFAYLSVTRFLMSFRQRNKIHLGTMVYHHETGRVMYVSQANRYRRTGERLYSLTSPYDRVIIVATRTQFEKMPGCKNWWYNATSWWHWYRQCWLKMDARAKANGKQFRSVHTLGKDRATAKR